jgi:hypothetical protein
MEQGRPAAMAAAGGATKQLKEEVDSLASSLDAVHIINASWNNSVAEASAHVSHWEGMLSSAEGALDILNKQIEAGIPLSEEQKQQYDDLTWAVGRYAGGVADEEASLVSAEAARARYNKGLDDLNAQLASGELNQEQFNQAAAELAKGIDPAIVSSENLMAATEQLYGSIEELVSVVSDLIASLGLIPETTDASVTLDTGEADQNLSVFAGDLANLSDPELVANVHIDSAQENISVLGGDIANMSDPELVAQVAIDNALQNIETVNIEGEAMPDPSITATADVTNALTNIGNLQGAIDSVPRTFTINPYVNTDAAIAAIWDLNAYIPQSPAEKGPFKTQPSWDWVFEGMPDAAETASSRATEIASAIISGMAADTSRIGELAGHIDDRVALQLSRRYQELGDDLQDAILSGADEETRAKLQSELDAAGALLARWSENTGRTIQDLVGVATDEQNWMDAQAALEDLFSTISGQTQDIISGGYISDLEGQLKDLRTELLLLEGINAPEIVLAGVRDDIGETIRELELAGQLYGEAVRRGMVEAFERAQREQSFWELLTGSMDDFTSGDLVERMAEDIAALQRDIAVLSMAGAPQAMIDALSDELATKEGDLARIGGIMTQAIAEGLIEDPALKDAVVVMTDDALAQIRALMPVMGESGAALARPLADSFLEGGITPEQFMAMFPVDVLRDAVLPELERLEDSLTVDLVEAMLTGADGVDELNAKLQLLAQLLGLIKQEAGAVAFNDGFLITGPGAGEVGSQGQGQRPRYGPVAAGYVAPSASSTNTATADEQASVSGAGAPSSGPSSIVNNIYLPSGELLYSELVDLLDDQKRRVLG